LLQLLQHLVYLVFTGFGIKNQKRSQFEKSHFNPEDFLVSSRLDVFP
jgi:hypothetical protein